MKGPRYDAAYKKEAIRMVNESGQSVAEVAAKLGIHIKIVGWAMDSTMTQQLVINALKQAIGRTKPP